MVNGSLTGIGNGRLRSTDTFFHTTSLVSDRGGDIPRPAVYGRPNGDRNRFSVTPYGTPYCGCTPDSVPEPFASFGGSIGLQARAGSVLRRRQRHRVGDSHLTVRIDGDTAPFKHPGYPGTPACPAQTAGEDTFIAQLVEDHAAHQLVEHSGAPCPRRSDLSSDGSSDRRRAGFW